MPKYQHYNHTGYNLHDSTDCQAEAISHNDWSTRLSNWYPGHNHHNYQLPDLAHIGTSVWSLPYENKCDKHSPGQGEGTSVPCGWADFQHKTVSE